MCSKASKWQANRPLLEDRLMSAFMRHTDADPFNSDSSLHCLASKTQHANMDKQSEPSVLYSVHKGRNIQQGKAEPQDRSQIYCIATDNQTYRKTRKITKTNSTPLRTARHTTEYNCETHQRTKQFDNLHSHPPDTNH